MRRGIGLLLCLLLAMPVAAISYLAFETVTVGATSIGFTNATIVETAGHPAATIATCRLETAEIRVRYDGTAPTATVGMLLEVGDTMTVTGSDVLRNFRAIRTTAVSGVLDCHYSTP